MSWRLAALLAVISTIAYPTAAFADDGGGGRLCPDCDDAES